MCMRDRQRMTIYMHSHKVKPAIIRLLYFVHCRERRDVYIRPCVLCIQKCKSKGASFRLQQSSNSITVSKRDEQITHHFDTYSLTLSDQMLDDAPVKLDRRIISSRFR
jgi:hypothetical protein